MINNHCNRSQIINFIYIYIYINKTWEFAVSPAIRGPVCCGGQEPRHIYIYKSKQKLRGGGLGKWLIAMLSSSIFRGDNLLRGLWSPGLWANKTIRWMILRREARGWCLACDLTSATLGGCSFHRRGDGIGRWNLGLKHVQKGSKLDNFKPRPF